VTITPLSHVPVVAGAAYIENIRQLPSAFTATVQSEPENRVELRAVAVLAGGAKVGYLPPEIASHYFDRLKGKPADVPGRHASVSAQQDTGVYLLVDLTGVPCEQ
jgi:hypothetical protein